MAENVERIDILEIDVEEQRRGDVPALDIDVNYFAFGAVVDDEFVVGPAVSIDNQRVLRDIGNVENRSASDIGLRARQFNRRVHDSGRRHCQDIVATGAIDENALAVRIDVENLDAGEGN